MRTPLVCFSLLALFIPSLALGEEITFNEHIAPILWKNCAGCHRPGEVGPFSLLTYADAAKRADFLSEVATSRRMPPWKPDPSVGEFLDARRLTDQELSLLSKWAATGAKEGKPSDLPPPPKFPEGWQLGEPDLIVKIPEPFEIPADGGDVYRCFVVPLGIDTDRTVAAVEFRPGNRAVVHHALFFLDSSGKARQLDSSDPGPGYQSFGGISLIPTGGLGGWAPGANPRPLPEGMGRPLRKGSDLVMQVHYHPTGKPEKDQSELGIFFTKQPAQRLVMAIPVLNRQIEIPPGERRHKVTAQYTLPVDLDVVGATPHMHLLGREMKLTAYLPDGTVKPLIWIRDWDFNWQGQYIYQELIPLPKGTKLEAEAWYDNTADNPHNPNTPPRLVTYGEETTDEMCLCGVQISARNIGDFIQIFRAIWQQQPLLLK